LFRPFGGLRICGFATWGVARGSCRVAMPQADLFRPRFRRMNHSERQGPSRRWSQTMHSRKTRRLAPCGTPEDSAAFSSPFFASTARSVCNRCQAAVQFSRSDRENAIKSASVTRRGCETMGLAPSENPENLGKSTVAKVPVPILYSLGGHPPQSLNRMRNSESIAETTSCPLRLASHPPPAHRTLPRSWNSLPQK
jgi:hypothetical protein